MSKPEKKSVTGRPQKSEKSSRHKLAAIMRDRLQLDEEWFPKRDRPAFFDKIEGWKWNEFKAAFEKLVKLGCRWDVMLTCLARFDTYNTMDVTPGLGKYDSDDEKSSRPKTHRQTIGRPPGKDERESIKRNIGAAIAVIRNHRDLLFALGALDPPDDFFGIHLSADDAVMYLPRLLTWSRNLLSSESLGNFRTVQNAGHLVPCAYVDLVTPRRRTERGHDRHLPLEPVAAMLIEMSKGTDFSQAQLREALNRFKRQYSGVYKDLTNKIRVLHRSSTSAADGWQQLFTVERKLRRH
jgi:hypothetical protein